MANDLAATPSEKKEEEKVPYYKLFSFADKLDVLLMVVGAIAAIGNGVSQPLMTLIFGKLVDSFGEGDRSTIVHSVSKVALKLVYLGIGGGVASLLQMMCWMVTGERQAARIRGLYLKTILRQDIEFFDTQTSTGEIIGRMSGDTILIQDAMGEKVGKFIQFASTFLGGFLIAFCRGWLLAIVLCTCIPALGIAGAFSAVLMGKMATLGQAAYAEAGNVVEQTVGSIRTVQSFTGEKQAVDKYDSKLQIAYKAAAKQGLASGTGFGCMLFVVFATYGLAVWYGGKLIITKGYSGGKVVNVIMSIMTGGIAIGQAFPCVNSFASGQAAAYKMFETINRKPKIDAECSGIVLEDIKGEIELKDVYFRYPARPEVQIFQGFSISIPSGKTAALVGQSGSGKSTVISLVESIRTVASFSSEDKVMKMYEKKCEAPLNEGVKLGLVSGICFGIGSLALYWAQAFCFYMGAVLIKHNTASFGEVFKQPKIDSSEEEGTTLASVRGEIELVHVSFKYPTRPDIPIFRDLCLSIPSGKSVALVGESGSGKSTVIALIERFYNPDSGQIFLDGVELRKFKLSWLRHQMGLVSQEPVLFNDTIRANIAYGKKEDVTEEEIINATKAANAHNFISGLPNGYDTTVGERGVQLSGGQKQRIAISRAILKDPRILLLDEATSALDTESERIVQDALDRVMVNRTTVVVAHRLTTIMGADIIAVVKNGVISEKGKHDVLMKIKDGVYASLVALHATSQ
uniref:ABC transporter n=1 Tax=Salvia miltiorrhiza TaxID=226208 RepID=A0A8E6YHZ3_SALMI|nr:ABC transporter [Salvia miltiorrhiza]